MCYNVTIKGKEIISMEKKTTSGGGIGICGLLLVAFIVLKLCGVIAWPWIWVLAPLWIPIAIAVICLIVAILIR